MASTKVVAGIVVYEWIEQKMLYTTIGSMALFDQNCSFCKAGFGEWRLIIFCHDNQPIIDFWV